MDQQRERIEEMAHSAQDELNGMYAEAEGADRIVNELWGQFDSLV
jgi:hypothetical protein